MPFDAVKAKRAVTFFNNLKHTQSKWAGTSFNLRPFQEKIISDIYGTVQEDGLRQYKKIFIFIPRGNGKTVLATGFILYHFLGIQNYGQQIYNVANTAKQASIIYKECNRMISIDPVLSQLKKGRNKIIRTAPSDWLMENLKTKSEFMSLSSIPQQDGLAADLVVYDEIHSAPNRELYDVLSQSQGKREEPLFVIITTAGINREASLCYELYSFAKQVKEAREQGEEIAPHFYPVIYETPLSYDLGDIEGWKISNPALGDFRSLSEMQDSYNDIAFTPNAESTFRTKYLNQWADAGQKWLDMSKWYDCAEDFDEECLKGKNCFIGIDLSYSRDLTAVVCVFPIGDKFYVLPYIFAPEKLEKRSPYKEFIGQNYITCCKWEHKDLIDYKEIRRKVNELKDKFKVQAVVVDPRFAIQISQELIDDGLNVEQFTQTAVNYNDPTGLIERKIYEGKIRHNGNKACNWMMANVEIERMSSGLIRPNRPNEYVKIDFAVALIMAFAKAVANPDGYDFSFGFA